MSFAQDLDDAVGAGICSWLQTGGNAALTTVAISGALTPGGQVPALAAGLGILALNAGCAFDPSTGGNPPILGCVEASPGGYGTIWRTRPDGIQDQISPTEAYSSFSCSLPYNIGGSVDVVDITANLLAGGQSVFREFPCPPGTTFFLNLDSGTCAKTESPNDPVVLPPVQYVSPTTQCTYIVEQQAWGMLDNGYTYPIVKISAGGQQLRTGGGIIQGCNFDPVLYVGPPGGGGGGTYIPWVDDPSDPPWWLPLVQGLAGGIVGALTNQLLEELFKKQVGEKVYRLVSVCETDAQGEPVSESREVPIPTVAWDEAIIWRLDALEYLLQGLKDFRQPICKPQKPVGDLVTVHFESDAPSIAGERPLRKYLRYRDQMASDLAAHAAHWENFSWQAGPVIVSHVGAPWGELQVWATDVDEGKRVIRHAGTIAGISPDMEGEWEVTASSDPRYGRSGTMRLAKRKSGQGMVLRISKRGGPDGLPIVPVDPLP